MKHLEEQAMYALKISCENYGNAGEERRGRGLRDIMRDIIYP
jgi:hypothetical protein